jgi:hypothetical protein
MDCVLIQDGRAHQIWPDTTKHALCYKVHEGETSPRAVFPQALIDAIREVEAGSVQIGATWDGEAFTNPPEPEEISNPIVPGGEFLLRVTDEEYLAVVNAANTAFANGNPQMTRWLELIRVNGVVNVESGTAIAAKAALVAAGLLTQERADIVFAPAQV